MGRITIFAADGCPHCKRVKVALADRNIPYAEVSVTKYPEKRKDMLALSDRVSTPQVFFNTRHVGGADETIALLQVWDKEKNKYASAYDRYMDEIGNHFDPSNPRLAIPHDDPVEPEAGPSRGEDELSVSLPNGRKVSVVETTELLKRILPSTDNVQARTKHKMSFSGQQAVSAFTREFGVSKEKANAFGTHLQKQKILHSIGGSSNFDDTDDLFRLQCYSTPDILNSYRIWTEKADPDPMRMLNRLAFTMNKLEGSVTNGQGNIDYAKAITLPCYTVLEEAVCELQTVDLRSMDDNTKTAFGINLYNLMIKYAFMKLGAGTNDISRLIFYNSVKFYVGDYVFSFQDWENGILRGNRKAPYAFKLQFGKGDPRLDLIVKEPDCRLHFSLNCGARSCPPVTYYSVEKLDEELTMAAHAFCEDDYNVHLDLKKKELALSKIFQWYKTDFARNNKELPSSILKFLRRMKFQDLDRLIEKGVNIKVSFKSYDWATSATKVKAFDSSELKLSTRTFKIFGSKGSQKEESDINVENHPEEYVERYTQ